MSTLRRIVCALAFLCLPLCAQAKDPPSQTIDVAGVKVAVWLPQDTMGTPVIIFSHGFHGCSTQSTFLMQALMKAGYAVFAPNHKDAVCNGGESSWFKRSQTGFGKPESWDETTYTDRKEDMEKLLNLLPVDPRFRSLDWKRVGLAGHSLGGYTVLALAGAWPGWKDLRVRAVLALSPYTQPFIGHQTLKNIHVPVMYQGGTRDVGITPWVKKTGGAYDLTPAPKYFVELDGAGHLAWTDFRSAYHEVIGDYSVAFFDNALKGKPFPQELLTPGEQVDEVKAEPGK